MTTPLKSWADAAPRLVAVAAGREAADLVIRGATWVNVQTREVLPRLTSPSPRAALPIAARTHRIASATAPR